MALLTAGIATQAQTTQPELIPNFSFNLLRSQAAKSRGCLPDAHGQVTIESLEGVERMVMTVDGLPANTGFDVFVIQLPNAPFGVAWYQSDLETQATGDGKVTVQGRFNHETFSLSQGGPANGSDPTQGVTGPAVKDTNVVFRPTSQFHVGLWFNSAEDAAAAGCPGNVTPFNGEQHAGGQLQSLYTEASEYHSEALAMAKEQAKEAKKNGDAYGSAALEFAVAYGVVRMGHIALFLLASRDDVGLRSSVVSLAISSAIACPSERWPPHNAKRMAKGTAAAGTSGVPASQPIRPARRIRGPWCDTRLRNTVL